MSRIKNSSLFSSNSKNLNLCTCSCRKSTKKRSNCLNCSKAEKNWTYSSIRKNQLYNKSMSTNERIWPTKNPVLKKLISSIKLSMSGISLSSIREYRKKVKVGMRISTVQWSGISWKRKKGIVWWWRIISNRKLRE